MFFYCPSLVSINLSSFDTSQVTSMVFMFAECKSLISLDLSNFLTTSVYEYSYMFYNSTKLEYLNLSEFSSIIKGKELSYDDAFSNTPDYLIYCINESKPQSDIFLNQLKAKKCSMNYCLSDWESKRKKYVKENDLCIGDCSMISFYEYNTKCFSICPNGTNPTERNPFLCLNISESDINNSLVLTDEIIKEESYTIN